MLEVLLPAVLEICLRYLYPVYLCLSLVSAKAEAPRITAKELLLFMLITQILGITVFPLLDCLSTYIDFL